jgi:L-lactate dehydrogenase complex protein LldF
VTATTVRADAGEVRDDDREEVEKPFRERYDEALHNPRLAKNVTRYQQNWRSSRTSAMGEVEFIDLREELRAAKTDAIDRIDEYLDQFKTMAERAGAKVHFASDAADANRIVLEICKERGITEIVKSKSMVSEEVHLNHHLEAAGIEAVETDIGEWIVQKAGQRPSHIVGPALHMGRQEVGELLNKRGHAVDREDIPHQVEIIKNEIRPHFFTAGAGMTGANALIAETGTVVTCTNEGNARATSSIPPVHIVLAGIEKLLPTWDDLVTHQRLLGRSGTGQRITVYSTFMTGPTPGHEMHIILVDNGRRAMRAMPEFREALNCIRCGACANVCPPYREVGGHVFGYIYTGAIGLVVTQFHHGLDAIAKPQSLCLSCNACETVCPVGIPLPRQIIDTRKMVVAKKGLAAPKKIVFTIYASPKAVDLVSKIGSRAQKPLERHGMIRGRAIPILNKQTRWRSLPALAMKPLKDRLPQGGAFASRTPVIPNGAAGKSVALFAGCMTDRLFPEQGEAVVDSLRALGVRVVIPAGLNCCGLPANNSGDEPHAIKMAKQTISALEKANAEYIVSGSASCVATLADDYLHLFRNDPAWLKRAEKLSARVVDFTTFMDKVVNLPAGSLAAEGAAPVITYHDSCQGLNALGLHAEPRRLLADVMGIEIKELPENTLCCGFGGSFGFDYPAVSERLMNRKLNNAESTGAGTVVTDNQGCIMHLRGGCDASDRKLQVKHLAELIAERLAQVESFRGTASS